MSARFAVGDRVTVRNAAPPGHVRTPTFIRGHTGIVCQDMGAYANPEELAYGRPGKPAIPLYRVKFMQRDLWPDYEGPASDSTVVDVYEHWLDKAGDAA